MKTHTKLKLLEAVKALETDTRAKEETNIKLMNRCNYALERALILENQEDWKEHRNSLLLYTIAAVVFIYERMNSEKEPI